jgi:hypothetical protein
MIPWFRGIRPKIGTRNSIKKAGLSKTLFEGKWDTSID